MSRMPCSITDGPQYDDDELFPPKPVPNPDDYYDDYVQQQLEDDFLFKALKSSMEPLITAHSGDKV